MKPSELLAFYKNESPLEIELAGRRYVLPMSDIFAGMSSRGSEVPCRKIEATFHVDNGLSDYVVPILQQLEKDGNFFDGTVVRIGSLRGGWMHLQPASYLEGIATNFRMDHLPAGRGLTLRQWVHGEKKSFVPFEMCRLVNHIGVVCMVETADGKLIVQQRGNRVANRGNTLNASVSGAVNWEDIEDWRLFNIAGVVRAVLREGLEELGVDLERTAFLGMFREFMRGGKPEAYFYARTKEPFNVVLDRWENHARDNSESTGLYGYKFLSDELSPDTGSVNLFEERVRKLLTSVETKANLTLNAGILLTARFLLDRAENDPALRT